MSLLRLLTAGKSLDGVNDTNSKYQMGDPRSMPKFGSDRNPFRTTVDRRQGAASSNKETAEVAVPQTLELIPAEEPAELASEAKSGRTDGVTEAEQAKPEPAAGEAKAAATEPVDTAVPGEKLETKARSHKPGLFRRIFGSLNSLIVRRENSAATKRNVDRTPIQGELALESVKVVRNDLSDTDLEIIPAKPAPPKAKSEKTEAAFETAKADALVVSEAGGQVSGAGKT